MAKRITLKDWHTPVLVLASLALVIASLYWARSVLIPVALAILLSFTLRPLVSSLQKLRLARVPAVLVVLLLTTLAVVAVGATVVREAESLAIDLPNHKDEIIRKIVSIQEATRGSFGDAIGSLVRDVDQTLQKKEVAGPNTEVVPVKIEESATPWYYVSGFVAPALEPLVTTLLVVVLTAFMLIQREDLRNRVIRLWGHGSVTRMTRALDDAGTRISRYLLTQAMVNSGFGLALAAGLWFIGVPYALLWGLLGAVLRYVPYLGIWLAAVLPVVLCLAIFPTWGRPALVLAYYVALDLLIGNALEPLLYGHSIGVSAVALLVAAVFWSWLWGPIGLVLATPLTACLVVIGHHLPQLEFLSILLGDEPALPAPIAYYQRLLARDEDEATDLIEEYCRQHTAEQVYDDVLVPALVLAKNNRERGELTRSDERFMLRVTREVVDEVVRPHTTDAGRHDGNGQATGLQRVLVLGCPARDAFDELALYMFQQLVESPRCRFEVLSAVTLSAEVLARVAKDAPTLVCIAALPPEGLAHTRYLCKRLRAQAQGDDLKILVGRWGPKDDVKQVETRLEEAGADFVAAQLSETRRQLLPLVKLAAAQPRPDQPVLK
jgi:predicted PurR-regulated permease PerM